MCRVKAVRLRRFTLTAAKRSRLSLLRCRREGRSLGMKSRFPITVTVHFICSPVN